MWHTRDYLNFLKTEKCASVLTNATLSHIYNGEKGEGRDEFVWNMGGIRRAMQALLFLFPCLARQDNVPEKWKQRKEQATSSILEIVSFPLSLAPLRHIITSCLLTAVMQIGMLSRTRIKYNIYYIYVYIATIDWKIYRIYIHKYTLRDIIILHMLRDENFIEFGNLRQNLNANQR